MQCVIPCAGQGKRMRSSIPKVLLPIYGKPILQHIVDQWKPAVDSFVFVVGHQWTEVIKLLPSGSSFIIQDEPRGLADAILLAEQNVKGKFIVALGDCIHKGYWEEDKKFDLGIGVWTTDFPGTELFKNYSVEISNGKVKKVLEKPSALTPNTYCGMGTYFLDTRVFDYIRKAKYTPGGGDLTEVLQFMIDSGEEILPIYFQGEYINITYPKDLKKAEGILK